MNFLTNSRPDYALGDYDYFLSQVSEVRRSFDALSTKINFASLKLKPVYVEVIIDQLLLDQMDLTKINSILITYIS